MRYVQKWMLGSQGTTPRYSNACTDLCRKIGITNPNFRVMDNAPRAYCSRCHMYFDIFPYYSCLCCGRMLRTRPRGKLRKEVKRY